MKALTLHQPWAWAVAHAGKDIENRTWKPPASVIGQRIAIHAGKRFDEDAASWMPALGHRFDGSSVHGAVVATALCVGWTGNGTCLMDGTTHAEDTSPWFFGPIGWLLSDVIALSEPVPCKGKQGLWVLPDDVEVEVRRQIERAV